MSDTLTSRADAKLKRLPLPLMAEFVALLGRPGTTQKEALAWLAGRPDGCKSSAGALSEHFSWLVARVNAWQREQRFLAHMAAEKDAHPDLTDEEIFRRGQRLFSAAAIADQDPDAWRTVQTIEQKRAEQALEVKKFRRQSIELFIEWAAKKRATELALGPATNADKIAQLGELMFGRDWQA